MKYKTICVAKWIYIRYNIGATVLEKSNPQHKFGFKKTAICQHAAEVNGSSLKIIWPISLSKSLVFQMNVYDFLGWEERKKKEMPETE